MKQALITGGASGIGEAAARAREHREPLARARAPALEDREGAVVRAVVGDEQPPIRIALLEHRFELALQVLLAAEGTHQHGDGSAIVHTGLTLDTGCVHALLRKLAPLSWSRDRVETKAVMQSTLV